MSPGDGKVRWRGVVTSVQPRIRLTRSFDERSHTYQGYVLRVRGAIDGEQRDFVVAIGEASQARHGFCVGDEVSGEGVRVADQRTEVAELYKVSKLAALGRRPEATGPPPWHGVGVGAIGIWGDAVGDARAIEEIACPLVEVQDREIVALECATLEDPRAKPRGEADVEAEDEDPPGRARVGEDARAHRDELALAAPGHA